MRFGRVPLQQAEGAILAHSLRIGGDGTVQRFGKGQVLTAQDVTRLSAAGLAEVTVARLDPGDVDENQAARLVAEAMAAEPLAAGVSIDPAANGRVNLRAARPGVMVMDEAALQQANLVNPHITIATLRNFNRVEDRALLVTVKIITYGVPSADVDAVSAIIKSAIRVQPPVVQSAVLIETKVSEELASDKGRRATLARLNRFGVDLAPRIVVPHDDAALARALSTSSADLILILTGSATSDPHDTAPLALVQAGGVLRQFGMPVDPGNLLFLGDLEGTPVIGLPGCARSPALNGADWVLDRVICGIDVGPLDIARMGAGGLLKESPARPKPRER